MKTTALLLAFIAGFFCNRITYAQSGSPVPPELLTGYLFQDTNFLSIWGDEPLSQTNLALFATWDNYGLQVDTTNAAWLSYTFESEGYPNLYLTNGTLEIWVQPNWISSGLGGTGSGVWSRIIDVGAWTSNASYGWWSVFTDPSGDNIFFSAQSNNGTQTNYLTAPIAWDGTTWHQIVLTYSTSSTCLYLDGALATNGSGITILPPPEALSNGFYVFSDQTGVQQFHGQADRLWIYGNQETDTNEIANEYAYYNAFANPPPHIGSLGNDDPSPPGGGGGGGTNGGGGPTANGIYDPPYGSNQFWLQILPVGTNAYNADTNAITFILWGTTADIDYQIQMTTNIQTSNVVWTVVGDVIGSEVTNFTATTFSMLGFPTAYFQALPYTLDSDGDGLPDWWEIKYSTADFPLSPTNADTGNTGIPDGYKQDSAGDGWNNLQKYQMGIPPNVWITPPPASDVAIASITGSTNDSLTWQSAGGSVSYYEILDSSGTEITEMSASATNFTFSPALYSGLTVRAYYANGSYSDSSQATTYLPSLNLQVIFTPGSNEQSYVVVPSVPSNLSQILFNWQDWYDSLSGTIAYSATNLVNGVGVAPTFITNGYPAIFTTYTLVDSNGNTSASLFLGYYLAEDIGVSTFSDDPGFSYIAGQAVQIDQNLKFLLREASATIPFSYYSTLELDGTDIGDSAGPWEIGEPEYYYARGATSTNYEFYGSRRYIPDWGYSAIFPTGPVADNFMWRNFVFNAGDFTNGWIGTGAVYDSGNSIRAVESPSYVWNGDTSVTPLPLEFSTTNSPYLIEGQFYENPILADVGVISTDGGETYTAGISGVKNCFGLSLQTVALGTNVLYSGNTYSPSETNDTGKFSVNFTAPLLYPVDFYFASQSAYINGNGSLPPLPCAPGFSPTNTSPLLITSVGQGITVSAWAKEEIQNGGSGKYAYAEQYFSGAYTIGTNGSPTTNSAGVLSPFGEFFPTRPGPAALVTVPEINSGLQGTGIVNVISLQVDANHDGTMDTSYGGPDTTTVNKPFVFWINNDQDAQTGAGNPDRDFNMPHNPNFESGYLTCERDLEDFARLWICGVPPLTNSGYQVTLSWTNVTSGSPSIELFNSIETNGGTGYLTDSNVAAAIIAVTNYVDYAIAVITNGSTFTFPANFFTNGANKYFLFEGAGVGQGQLVLTISANGTNVASSSVFMNLMDVKSMFEHAEITGVTNTLPGNPFALTSYQENNILPPNPNEDTNLILFVHGWRMGNWDYQNFSETMFKRLYWQGFQGRFLSLRWSTLSQDDFWLPALDYFTYNSSEFNAWKSGAGLSAYFTHLKQRFPNYSLNVCAHSMGNVVVAEALRQQLAAGQTNVHNYVLMQAAIPASCFDTNFTNYAPFIAAEESQPTPNTYQGYPGPINGAITGHMVDFYNTNDYALATGALDIAGITVAINWEANQENFKPNTTKGYRTDGTNCYNGFNVISDPREIMAFCSRPRSKAVGAQPGVAGVIQGGDVDLTLNFNFQGGSDEHSAEFNWNIQQVWNFYSLLLDDLTAN